jgi:predicted Zn-dependent protease
MLCAGVRAQVSRGETGAALAAQIREHTSPLPDPAVHSYLARVANQLTARDWDCELVVDDMGGPPHEPVAIPGNHLFVPAPLILAASNEDEVAGMFALAIARLASKEQGNRPAVQSMAAAGYQPSALVAYIRRTSPYRERRIAALETAMTALPPVQDRPHAGFKGAQERVRQLTARPPHKRPSLLREGGQ